MTMGKGWNIYRTSYEVASVQAKKIGRKMELSHKDFLWQLGTKILEIIPDKILIKRVEMMRLHSEGEWAIARNKPTLFIEDSHLIDFLLGSSTKQESMEGALKRLPNPFNSLAYCIAPPSGYTYGGIGIRPFLFSVITPNHQKRMFTQVALQHPTIGPDSLVIVFMKDNTGESMHHYDYKSLIARNLENPTTKKREFSAYDQAPTDHEAAELDLAFRFAVRLQVYMKCFPEMVRDGLPVDLQSGQKAVQ